MNKARILTFLKREVPYTKERIAAWKKEVRALGSDAPAILIETLRTGSAIQQDSALLALREFGYEAWAHGFRGNVTYSVAKAGTPTLHIVPIHTEYEMPEEPKLVSKPRKVARKATRAAKVPRTPHKV